MTDRYAPENLIDLDRYPLLDLDSDAAQAVIDEAKSTIARDGAVSFPGFLKPGAIASMADQAEALVPLAYPGPTRATPYFFNYDIATSDDPTHPVRRTSPRRLAQVAYDLIPPESALYRLYHWDPVPAFLAKILEHDRLYRMVDPYQSLNISIMEEGGCQQWHFDRGLFVTTLLLQAPEGGGVFEYVPNLRDDGDEHFTDVRAVLDGDRDRLRRIEIEPGMLNLFMGHYAMHRVTPVEGKRRRIQTALAYATTPDRTGNLKSSILHYGPRVAVRAGLSAAERDALIAG